MGKTSLVENIDWLQKSVDREFIALGSIVTPNSQHMMVSLDTDNPEGS